MTRRVKVYDQRTDRLQGFLESDDGEAWHWVASRRNARRLQALGKSFGSVWGSIAEFRESCHEPIVIQF